MISTQQAAVTATAEHTDYQRTLHVNASPDAVFDALTRTADLSDWWAQATGSGTAGGELKFFMNADDPLVINVTAATRSQRVHWNVIDCPFLPDWVGTRPTFTITPDADGGSELSFKHIGLHTGLECIEMCTRGWDHFLPSLVKHVEAGNGEPHGSAGDQARRRAERAA